MELSHEWHASTAGGTAETGRTWDRVTVIQQPRMPLTLLIHDMIEAVCHYRAHSRRAYLENTAPGASTPLRADAFPLARLTMLHGAQLMVTHCAVASSAYHHFARVSHSRRWQTLSTTEGWVGSIMLGRASQAEHGSLGVVGIVSPGRSTMTASIS